MRFLLVFLFVFVGACANDAADPGVVAMRLDPDGTSFYAMPFPNDLLRDAASRSVDFGKFPNPEHNTYVQQAIDHAGEQRSGFSLLPVVSIAFDGELNLTALIADDDQVPAPNYPLYFLNIDKNSSRFGEKIPAVADFFLADGNYVVQNLLTMAPWGGFTLAPGATYAAIVERGLGDADGRPLRVNAALSMALAPDGAGNALLRELFAPLRSYLGTGNTLRDRIAAATVFTTGTPARDMAQLMRDVGDKYVATVAQPFVQSYNDDDFCFLEGKLRYPQFQTGEAPYGESGSGLISFGSDGMPLLVGYEDVRTIFVVPNGKTMPTGGFPYVEYIHGSGGIATQLVDRGRNAGEGNVPWRGPGWWLARKGIASGSQAMPISPDRVPDVGDYDYFQLTNFAATRGNFQQGVIEEELKHRFLYAVTFPASLCPDGLIPGGKIRFKADGIGVTGQSMGAMYVNLYASIATDVSVMLPTGSGGYWSYFIFSTEFIPGGAGVLLGPLVGVGDNEPIGPLHPVMGLVEHLLEAIDPIMFLPRILRDPLPGTGAKSLYVPFGYRDSYFSPGTQRKMAANYGVPRMGDAVDPLMDNVLEYYYGFEQLQAPVSANLDVGDGNTVTGVQVQHLEDSVTEDGHYIIFQVPQITHQYTCFAYSALLKGKAEAIAGSLSDPQASCP